ncbi:MAG: tRNA pseudouridine(38-40) synthase TruA [Coriobacteriales bacterium]|nr:tRNA pseudouridine(38-40) synthase TruA [Coriobacteriales bacterium]
MTTDSSATLVLKVGYRGAGFSGYAEQDGERTVAGELRRALEVLLRRPCELTCAGRTDAGVSALAQYVSLPVMARELEREPRRVWRSLMAITPEDISIRGLYVADQGFSARFDAQSRSYRYRIACGNAQPVLAWDYAWWVRNELDVESMSEAVQALVGEHDFRSFCKVSSAQKLLEDGRSTNRCVTRAEVTCVCECGEDLIAIDVDGNAFLHNMVRIIVGSLVEVGRGNRSAEWLQRALVACDRRAAGPTAPAKGLVFQNVVYPTGALVPWK